MKTKYTFLILSVLLLASCGPTISSKDEASFKASKAKMEENLDKADKEKLEIALRVVVMKAMKEKFDKPDDAKYKGKSFDEISMVMIDGKTFSGLVSYAEDFLQEDRDRNIESTNKEIDSLTTEKTKFIKQNEKLNQLKLTDVNITREESFGKMSLYLNFTLVNNTGAEILRHMIGMDIVSKKTGEVIQSIQSGNNTGFDDEIKEDDKGVLPGEEISMKEYMGDINADTDFFKNAKYPITDFSKLDFIVKVFPTLIITKKEKLIRTKGIENLDKEVEDLQLKLKELKETKGTLDELELTN
ncbi:MAG: hypothetical protein ABIP95_00585 [Pelobium sp.]